MPELDAVPQTSTLDLPSVGAPVPAKAPAYPEQTLPFGQPEGSPGKPGDLPNYQEQWQAGEAGPGLSPKPDKWDKAVGGLSQGVHDSAAGTLYRLYKEKTADTGTILQPDQANKLNPYRAMPYTMPVDSNIVAMEAADGRKQQQIQEWLGRNDKGGDGWGRFAGGLVDAPMYAALGLMTGGLGDVGAAIGVEAAGSAGGLLGRYGVTLAEFAGVGKVQTKIDASMGAREKSFTEVVHESMGGAALATGIHLLARRFFDKGEANPELAQKGIKDNAAAMANDERPPTNPMVSDTLSERKAGVSIDPAGNKILPTVKTSPMGETPLYGATHADGTPLTHEHGLGPGVQLTDSHDVANNGVSRSQETPGQIHETQLPPDSKLLDIDQTASDQKEFIKAIEEKTGVPVSDAIKSGESLKDIITNLSDWAGADIGDHTVPEDILKQVQDVAKEQGFSGYQFAGENSRQAHVFDPTGMTATNIEHADPSRTPDVPTGEQPPATPEEAEARENMKQKNYSPAVQDALNEIRKTSKTMHPDDLESQIADAQKTTQGYKEQLQERAKENPEVEAALKELREQEVHDKRMLDVAKRIINCGASE